MKTNKRRDTKVGIEPKPLEPAIEQWLEDVTLESLEETQHVIEAVNDAHRFEKYRMPGDFRTQKEKYQSHMVIIIRKDELPDFNTMNAKAVLQWCKDNDASSYLHRDYLKQFGLKALLWALRAWKNVKPKPLKRGEFKVLQHRHELPKDVDKLEYPEFWKTHRLTESLIKRLPLHELYALGWKLHGQRLNAKKPKKFNPNKPPERKVITRVTDLPDWSRMTYEEEADWYDENEMSAKFRTPLTPKEQEEFFRRLAIRHPVKRSKRDV
jgi:hypothetical protein